MKARWRKKRRQAGKPGEKPNLICGPVQTCWHRFARYFDVELRQIPCRGERLQMSPEEVLRRCDENTIGVVATLGVTYTLQYEPVQQVSLALDDLEEEHGLDIPIHIDAASGGFIAPFIHPSAVWDFRLPRVKSVNASGHKFGLAPLGCGWAIWREAVDLPQELIFHVKVLGGNMPTLALNFSRPGGQVIAQYYNFVRLGREGYTKITQACADVGAWFADEIKKLGIFDLVYNGRGGIPGCTWTLKKESRPSFFSLRYCGPSARKRLASARISNAGASQRSGSATHGCTPGCKPRFGWTSAGRSATGHQTSPEKSCTEVAHEPECRRLSSQLKLLLAACM